jgi:hypothetical protein
MFRIGLVLSFIVFSFTLHSQDVLLLMNGREWKGQITSLEGTVITLSTKSKKGKVKEHQIDKTEIFSYTKAGEKEVVLYAQDEMIGDIYSPDQMKVYIVGEQDARDNFHARPTAIVGFIICGAVAYYVEGGLMGSIALPIAYSIFQLAPKIHIREQFMSDTNYKYNDFYADGFEPVARTKKILTAMGSGFAGAVAGVVVYAVINGGL